MNNFVKPSPLILFENSGLDDRSQDEAVASEASPDEAEQENESPWVRSEPEQVCKILFIVYF